MGALKTDTSNISEGVDANSSTLDTRFGRRWQTRFSPSEMSVEQDYSGNITWLHLILQGDQLYCELGA